jgi:cell division protein FtsN
MISMGMYDQIVQEVMQQTNNDLMLLFVLLLATIVTVYISLYRMNLKERKERLKYEAERQSGYVEREKEVIAVIKENTEVNSALKTTLELMSVATNTSIARIHERLDEQSQQLTAQGASISGLQSSLDDLIRK